MKPGQGAGRNYPGCPEKAIKQQDMGEIINLREQRKHRRRAEKEAQAAANRVRHGRSKADRNAGGKEKDSVRRDLDGKRLDPDDGN